MENLEDGYLDLKLNQCISNFRNRYKDEYICIKEFNIFLYEVQCEIGKKGVSQQNAFIVASLTELQKIFCSCILLCERGLPESANILVRTILELSFKIIEVVRNKEFVEDLLLAESFEKLVIVNEIEKSRLFDLVPPQKLNELRKKINEEIKGRNKPETKVNHLVQKNKLNREYILYRLQCEHAHQSTRVIGELIKITDKGVYIDGDFRLKEFKTLVAWTLSIITIALDVLLKEYIDNKVLMEKYNSILTDFERYFKDLLDENDIKML